MATLGGEQVLDRLIDQIYLDFAKARPDPTSVEMLRALLGGCVGGIHAMPLSNSFAMDYVVRAGFGPRPDIDRRIRDLSEQSGYGSDGPIPLYRDPLPRGFDILDQIPAKGAAGELRAFYLRIGIRHLLSSSCLIDNDWRYHLFIARGPNAPAFGKADEALLGAVVPHFRSALRARTRLITSASMAECCAAGLDKLGIGVAVFDPARRLADLSPVAERIMQAKDGLVCLPHLAATDRTANRRLQSLLREAAHDDWHNGGAAIAIPRPSGQLNYELLIDALPRPLGLQRDGSVVIYMRDRASGPARAIEAGLLQELFGLTEAEALVARAAADGRSSQEIASNLGIRHNTVRAHFRSIFAKSGFTSRADLVHMLLSSPAALGERKLDGRRRRIEACRAVA